MRKIYCLRSFWNGAPTHFDNKRILTPFCDADVLTFLYGNIICNIFAVSETDITDPPDIRKITYIL